MAGSPSRMLTLLSLLQTRRDWPGPVLAERLDVSDRTLRRDVGRLRELGYRITAIKGPDGGYRLDAGTQLPPLLFDDEQAVALALALQTAASAGTAESDGALRALATVRQLLPGHLRNRIDGVSVVSVSSTRAAPPPPDVVVAVSAAVEAHQVLRFDYLSSGRATGDAVRHRVEPHGVGFSGGRWYLVAWEPDLGDWRVFRLDRMTPRLPAGPRFERRELPGGGVRDFLDARFRGSERAGVWPCVGEAVLALPARAVAPFVEEGTVEELGPDRCRLTIGSWSWPALAAALGRFDAAITAAAPAELREAFLLLAGRFERAGSESEDGEEAPATTPRPSAGARPRRSAPGR
ncbi:WYL domain-containing protein [Leifsonia sp. NPDC080035]|uniref:WYL domain-containing protein n=1 Tax=Leifsonia sp. NPDC080035 TaxID=3143936 RepID=A0AAU7GFW4_9MICO